MDDRPIDEPIRRPLAGRPDQVNLSDPQIPNTLPPKHPYTQQPTNANHNPGPIPTPINQTHLTTTPAQQPNNRQCQTRPKAKHFAPKYLNPNPDPTSYTQQPTNANPNPGPTFQFPNSQHPSTQTPLHPTIHQCQPQPRPNTKTHQPNALNHNPGTTTQQPPMPTPTQTNPNPKLNTCARMP